MSRTLNVFASTLLAMTSLVWAAPGEGVKALQQQWAQAMYKQSGEGKEEALEKLASQSRSLVVLDPQDADALVWEGIVLASYAGAKGGLGALALAKEAKAALERSLTINPSALQGSAYTSLGSLYCQVPGWPIGFGNNQKAEEMLKKGLEINPAGIDSNYFYGDFLFRQSRYADAEKVLLHALEAAPRPGRELADEGRRNEIRALLGKVRSKKS